LLIFIKMDEKQIRSGNRMAGLIAVVLGGGVAVALNLKGLNNVASAIAVDSGGVLLTAVGIGDLITGQNNYIAFSILKYFNERRNVRYLL
jgi:hypothetical protein